MRVPISAKLINDIDRQVRHMRDKEVSVIRPITEIMDDETGEWFIEWMWGEHIHLKAELPDAWKRDAGDSYVRVEGVPYPDVMADEAQPTRTFVVNYELLGDWTHSMPPNYERYGSARDVHCNDLPEQLRPTLNAAIDKWRAEQRWSAVTSQVEKFLRECPSLNKALELWPDLRVYVPEEYLEIVARPNPKRPKNDLSAAAAVLESLDKGTLMAAKVRERLADAEAMREVA